MDSDARLDISTSCDLQDIEESATERCLHTLELLENILRFLDTKTLLLSQRVSHTFKAIIEDRRALQQRLFRLPATTQDILEPDFLANQSERPYIFVDKQVYTTEELADVYPWIPATSKINDSNYTVPCMLNPLLLRLNRWRNVKEWPTEFRLNYLAHYVLEHIWRPMYLAHPMPAILRFRVFNHPMMLDGHLDQLVPGRTEQGGSRTLGEIADQMMVGRYAETCFGGWKGMRVQVNGRLESEYVNVGAKEKEARWEAKRERREERKRVKRREERDGAADREDEDVGEGMRCFRSLVLGPSDDGESRVRDTPS